MSWWQRLGDAVEATGRAVAAPAGFVLDVATAPWNDDEEFNGFVNTLSSRLAQRTREATAPLDYLAGPVDEAVGSGIMAALNWSEHEVWQPWIARPLSTVSLAADEAQRAGRNRASIIEQMFYGGTDIGTLLSGETWQQAWANAGQVSPGQALATRQTRALGGLERSLGFESPAGTPRHPGFDVLDPAQREAYFSSLEGRLASGAADIVSRWYLDPLVIGGKGAKALRLAAVVRPITPKTNIDKVVQSTRTSKFLGEVFKRGTPNERMDWLLRNRVVGEANDGPALASMLAHSDDADQARAVLRVAMFRDPNAILKLQTENRQLATALERLQDVRVPQIEHAMSRSRNQTWFTEWGGRKLEELSAEAATLRGSAAHNEMLLRAEGSLQSAPRITPGQRLDDKVRWSVWQPSRYNIPVRILRSAGTMRAGIVDFQRPDSIVNVQRYLDRIGHGIPGKGLDRETKGRLLDAYAKAGDEPSKKRALQTAEQIGLRHIARNLGLDPKVADEALREGWRRRDERMARLRERAYSGAPGKDGHYLDYIEEDGVGVREAILTTQITNQWPMLDVDAVGRVLSRYRSALAGNEDGFVKALQSARAQKPVEWSSNHLEEIASLTLRVWKPAQLIRLGWPIRILGDEQFRVISVVGVMTHLPLATKSLGSSVRSGSRRTQRSIQAFRAEKLAELERRRATLPTRAVPDEDFLRESAIRDAEGNLLRVYHGTGHAFGRFDDSKADPEGWFGAGHYFTTDPEQASQYARASAIESGGQARNVRIAYLDIRKPWNFLEDELARADIEALARQFNIDPSTIPARAKTLLDLDRYMNVAVEGGPSQARFNQAVRELLESRGYDGIKHVEGVTDAFVAFRAKQIHAPYRPTKPVPDDADVAKLVAEEQRLLALMAKQQPVREFGVGELDVGPYRLEDAYGAADMPNQYRPLASGRGMVERLASDAGRYHDRLRSAGGVPINIKPVPDNPLNAKAHATTYAKAWENAVNNQIGQDPVAKLVLAGKSDSEIVAHLRGEDGKALRKRIGRRGGDPHRWAGEVRQHVDHYLPTPELQALALKRKASTADLQRAIPEESLRPEIHGDSLELALGTSQIAQTWGRFVDRAYHALGSAPTDALTRHPFFVATYRQRLTQLVNDYDPGVTGNLSQDVVSRLQWKAREHSLRQVRRVLYDLSEESNLAHTLRFLMPFYAPWQETLNRWMRLSIQDPSRLARGSLMWQSPDRAGWTFEKDGETYIAAPVPEWVRKHVPGAEHIGQQGIPKHGLLLLAQGEPWFLPGTGPLVQVPVGEMVRNKPDLEESVKWILPYGAGENIIDQLLPAYGRRATTAAQEEDNRTYVNSFNRIAIELDYERRIGKNNFTDEQMYAEAQRRTKNFWRLRTLVNATFPYSPWMRSPYQFHWDKAKEYREKYADAKDEQGNPISWEERFLQDFGPDFFGFTESFSKSVNSVAPTIEGYQASKKYDDLLAKYPEYGSLWVGDEDSGTFSGAVYGYQYRQRVGPGRLEHQREMKEPREAIDGIQRREGWIMWRKASTLIEAQMVERGLTSLNQRGAEDLRWLKDQVREKLAEKHPAWYADFQEFDRGKTQRMIAALGEHAGDKRFDDRPGWTALRQYLEARKGLVALLQARKHSGGSANLQAEANSDLRFGWEHWVGTLRERDLDFGDLSYRWLEHDTLEGGE